MFGRDLFLLGGFLGVLNDGDLENNGIFRIPFAAQIDLLLW